MADLTKLGFFSENNYMKRSEFVGSQMVSLTASGGGPVDEETITINHNLGYIPQFHIFGDFFTGDSGIYPPFASQFIAEPNWVACYSWCTETTLTIYLSNAADTTRSLTVYWVIYLDYEGA